MKQSTLVFVFSDKGEIMLCMKKRGFGVGKWNGAGGKKNDDETIQEAAKRELLEETGVNLDLNSLEQIGLHHFCWTGKPEWDQDVHVFISNGYSGNFMETEEMKPAWFKINDIPYDNMWEDDIIWLPILISGIEFEYTFNFGIDGKMTDWKRHK